MSIEYQAFTTNFESLSKLLQPPEEQVSRDEVSKPTPAAIGPKDLLDVRIAAPQARKDTKEIWQEDELVDCVEDEIDDGREVPSYEFSYKQSVETTDAYLGMSGKDPSSTCCEDLVVHILLPSLTSAAGLDLDVKPTYLKLNSQTHKLSLYLPHKVFSEAGKAKFDAVKRTLSITLPIDRTGDLDL